MTEEQLELEWDNLVSRIKQTIPSERLSSITIKCEPYDKATRCKRISEIDWSVKE